MRGLVGVRNRCVRRPRFDVIYNDAFCPDCVMLTTETLNTYGNVVATRKMCRHQDEKDHLDGFVHCKKPLQKKG